MHVIDRYALSRSTHRRVLANNRIEAQQHKQFSSAKLAPLGVTVKLLLVIGNQHQQIARNSIAGNTRTESRNSREVLFSAAAAATDNRCQSVCPLVCLLLDRAETDQENEDEDVPMMPR